MRRSRSTDIGPGGPQTGYHSNRLAVVDGRRIPSKVDLAARDVAFILLSDVYGSTRHLAGDVFDMQPACVPGVKDM